VSRCRSLLLVRAARSGEYADDRLEQGLRVAAVTGGEVGLGALAGQVGPQVPGPLTGRRPGGAGGRARGLARLVAVAVPVGAALCGIVAVPVVAGAARGRHRD